MVLTDIIAEVRRGGSSESCSAGCKGGEIKCVCCGDSEYTCWLLHLPTPGDPTQVTRAPPPQVPLLGVLSIYPLPSSPQMPLLEVLSKYMLLNDKAFVSSLQERASKFAAMVAAFCEKLGWIELEMLISKFQSEGRGGRAGV